MTIEKMRLERKAYDEVWSLLDSGRSLIKAETESTTFQRLGQVEKERVHHSILDEIANRSNASVAFDELYGGNRL